MKRFFLIALLLVEQYAFAILAGGRPNSFSGGQNAFAGVINPANAVWIPDRIDVGAYFVHQNATLNNHDNNPLYPPGKINLAYKSRNLMTADIALHKHLNVKCASEDIDSSFSLAAYTTPGYSKVRTREPFAASGTTPIKVYNKTNVISAILSIKLNKSFSFGVSLDYLCFSHLRNGFQNADTPLRSVSPGHVTNNGNDHSYGLGITLGVRWNITERLHFGTAWSRKSFAGQYRKYRGYEPHHAHNYNPQLVGAGFTYLFTKRLAGRLETIWTNLGNLPGSNNNVLPNGAPNLNKRGSNKSPGPGLQDATYINFGLGYKVNEWLSLGSGYSHRIKLRSKSNNIASHSYRLQTIYDILSIGGNIIHHPHELFFSYSHGFKNGASGYLPPEVGGGKFTGRKENDSFSISYGYLY